MIKEDGSREAINHWTLMKNSQPKNNNKNKDRKLKPILSFWYFKLDVFPEGRLMKHKYRLCAHV